MVLPAWANRRCVTYNTSSASPSPRDGCSEGAGEGEANALIKADRPLKGGRKGVLRPAHRAGREDSEDPDSISVTSMWYPIRNYTLSKAQEFLRDDFSKVIKRTKYLYVSRSSPKHIAPGLFEPILLVRLSRRALCWKREKYWRRRDRKHEGKQNIHQ